jgi:hypothetical protein
MTTNRRTELVYHNFAAASEFAEVEEGAAAGLFDRVEVDFLLDERSVTIARSAVGVDEFLRFLRARKLKPFVHLVDDSLYSPRSLALFRDRIERSGIAIGDVIVGSTNVPGLQMAKREIPGIENQSRRPVLGIDYLHQFGPELLRRLEGADPARLGKADAIRRLFDFEIPAGEERDYERLQLITSFDPIDKVTGARKLEPDVYLASVRRIFAFPCMRLVITNGLARREYRASLRELVTP